MTMSGNINSSDPLETEIIRPSSPSIEYYLNNLDDLDGILELPPMSEMALDPSTTITATPTQGESHEEESHEEEEEDDDDEDHHRRNAACESPDSSKSWRLSNAVHMEMQDNAKVASFLLPVDRSGSSSTVVGNNKTKEASAFLESKRHYDYNGEEEESPKKRKRSNTTATDTFDPTPLSELQRRFRSPLPIPHATKTQETTPPEEKKPPEEPVKKTPGHLKSAVTQQTKYGFGRKHKVPAVPRDAAYERKKQRAKDARVRLNESIDRLGIAMTVASQQSQQRLRQCVPQRPRGDTVQNTIQECIQVADQAKKFDRPSFVGTAADMVHALNAQCDALAQRILQLQKRSAPPPIPVPKTTTSTTSTTLVDRASSVLQIPRVVQSVMGFLDPVSLSRCASVAKAFTPTCEQWDALALARFGVYHVRQGRDKQTTDEQQQPPFSLYKTLQSAHLLPRLEEDNSSLLLLGQTHIPNSVSCWVFVRQRSNGETLRSRLDSKTNTYSCVPMVELRWVVQSTCPHHEIVWKEQELVVDASTRRRRVEFPQVSSDPRLAPRLVQSNSASASTSFPCRLRLFETVHLHMHVQCPECFTMAKFIQRSNFTQVLVQQGTTTLPVVVPFPREGGT